MHIPTKVRPEEKTRAGQLAGIKEEIVIAPTRETQTLEQLVRLQINNNDNKARGQITLVTLQPTYYILTGRLVNKSHAYDLIP